MTASTKPLFGQAYRELLERTRQAEARQRRILRHRLVIWCLPWGLPIPFLLNPNLSMLTGDADLAVIATGAICLIPVLGMLGALDYQMKCDAGLEEGGPRDSRLFRWMGFFSISQLAIALGLALLLQTNESGSVPFRSGPPAADHNGIIKRSVRQCY